MAQREVDKDTAWRTDGAADAERTRQGDRGDPGFFQLSGNQSDRLMADGSDRYKKRDIGALIPDFLDDLRRELFFHSTR